MNNVASPDTSQEVRAELGRWVSEAFGIDAAALAPDQPLTSHGLDSLKAAQLNTFLGSRYGYEVPAEDLLNGLTFTELVTAVTSGARRAPSSPGQTPAAPSGSLDFSLFFFSSDAERHNADKYGLFLECAKFADLNGFHAVWAPERHFHRFGGLFPNPAVLAAALATATDRIRIRAGSVVLPLHDPVRVAEEWAVVDNLSHGRVDVAFATGWNPDDFVFAPDRYSSRQRALADGVDVVRRLWRGETVELPNGAGVPTSVRTFPAPLQPELPIWVTCTGGIERFVQAGELGANVLTALLFQDVDEIAGKLAAYRDARAAHGHDPDAGRVTVMLHAFLGADEDEVRAEVEEPFKRYLTDSVDLWSRGSTELDNLSEAERAKVLDFAFERYYRTSALFGTPDRATHLVRQLAAAGVDEIACLIDFGLPEQQVRSGLTYLSQLKDRWHTVEPPPPPADDLSTAMRTRHALAHRNHRGVLQKARDFDLVDRLSEEDLMPFYPELGGNDGATVWHDGRQLIMLGSNNYLGLTADVRVREAAAAAALDDGPSVTGSRLMNGSTRAHGELEEKLAHFVGRPDALLFTTGYQANIGLLSAFMTDGTALVVDEECHASIYDGAAVGGSRIVQFRHNDLGDLERRLARDVGTTPAMVMIDGVYSMSGDLAPLAEVKAICDRYGVPLALDDAHGLGTVGDTGRGVEEEFGLIGCADLLTGTFSKSFASVGGWIAGPKDLMDWVRYYGRSMLFSASIPPPAVAAAAASLEILIAEPERVARLRELSAYWRDSLTGVGFRTGSADTPIVPVVIGDEVTCLRFARRLMAEGVYANCVAAPAVPVNQAIIRTTVTAVHDKSHLDNALEIFAAVGRDLGVLPD